MSNAGISEIYETARNRIVNSALGVALGLTSDSEILDVAVTIEGVVDNGAISKTFIPSSSVQSYTIPEGYHNGNGKVICNAVNAGSYEISPTTIPSEHFILIIQKTHRGGLETCSCSNFNYSITNCTVAKEIHRYAANPFSDAGEYKGVVSWFFVLECTAAAEQVGETFSVTVTHSSGWNGTQTYNDNTLFTIQLL